jgi:hypothetical protein
MPSGESNIPNLNIPEFKPSIPEYMVNNLTDDTLKFLIEQVSIIKQQNKWQSEHLAEVYSYTRKINGKVIELEKHRQQQLIEKEIKDQIKQKSILNKKTFWPLVWTLGLFFYPLYISLFLEVGPTNVADFFSKIVP